MTAGRVLVLDFDGTMADTFSPSPGHVSTYVAYERAVKEVFGETELNHYRRQGGLKNRSPTQVVMDLGVPAGEVAEFTDRLVRRKLEHLMPEIGRRLDDGRRWPALTIGFLDFWRAAQKSAGSGHLRLASVSSGHREFIKRTFEVHHLEAPEVIICDDDLRAGDVPLHQRNKPDPLMLEMVAAKFGLSEPASLVYLGDDPAKDGVMARRAGVPFLLFDPELGAKLEADSEPNVVVFHAGTHRDGDHLLTAGGRVLGVTATGSDLREARSKAYAAARHIRFEGMQYRTDIGNKALQ